MDIIFACLFNMINPELKVGMYVLLGSPGRARFKKSGLAIKSYYHHGEVVAVKPDKFLVSLYQMPGSNFKLGQSAWFEKGKTNFRVKKR